MSKIKPHPNIVRLESALETRSSLYLILEYCDQGDLLQFIERRNPLTKVLPEREARVVIHQIVQGLTQLSECRTMHRDIKLENILVRKKTQHEIMIDNQDGGGPCSPSNNNYNENPITDFEFKLGDLGLAKVYDQNQVNNNAGVSAGFALK